MPQIFVSHSSRDEKLRPWFDTIFAGANLNAVRFEFEDKSDYPIEQIRFLIRNSDALFVLLTQEIFSSGTLHTGNWLSAEVGMAGGLNKPVWLFETMEEPISFPMPFIDHYLRLPFDDSERSDAMFGAVRNIVRSYATEDAQNLKGSIWLDAGHLVCLEPKCRARFQIYQSNGHFDRCPVCCTSQRWPVAMRICRNCQGLGYLGVSAGSSECTYCLGSGSFHVDMGAERCARCNGQAVTADGAICTECLGNCFVQWERVPRGKWESDGIIGI